MSRLGLVQTLSSKLKFSVERMVKMVQNARKDHLMIDFARQISTRFADMVAHFSALEGNPQSAHNNKTLFAEGIDIWFRAYFAEGADLRGPTTTSAIQVIEHVMTPWYEAMAMDDPSKYRARLTPPPVFMGDYVDAVALELGACACMEIQPLQFRFGMENGEPVHVWGRIYADGKWYDSDISRLDFKLGDRMDFSSTEDVEIPL
jgi:hypothetical protein